MLKDTVISSMLWIFHNEYVINLSNMITGSTSILSKLRSPNSPYLNENSCNSLENDNGCIEMIVAIMIEN